MSRILWIDDNPDLIESVTPGLTNLGIEVEMSDGSDMPGRLDDGYQLLVVDLNLTWPRDEDKGVGSSTRQDDRSGLKLLQGLYSSPESGQLIRNGSTKVLILSQHLADASWRLALMDFARESGIPAMLRSKYAEPKEEGPGGDGSLRSHIITSIQEAVESRTVKSLADEVSEATEAGTSVDPFTMPFSQYLEMNDVEKAAVQEQAFDTVQPLARDLFISTDSDWLVYCGSSEVPFLSDRGQIPTSQTLREIAANRRHPAFVVLRSYFDTSGGSPIEETDPPSRRQTSAWKMPFRKKDADRPSVGDVIFRCGGDLRNYPSVTLELGRRLRTFHFDTGSAASWVRASDVREHGIALDVIDRRMVLGRRGRYYTYPLEDNLECTLWDQQSEASLGVKIKGSAIEGYEFWEFARFCGDHGCQHGDVMWNGECIVRSGIVGRNLLTDNELIVTISSEWDQTHVRRIKKG